MDRQSLTGFFDELEKIASEVEELTDPKDIEEASRLEKAVGLKGDIGKKHRVFGIRGRGGELAAMTRTNPEPVKEWEGDVDYQTVAALRPQASIAGLAVRAEHRRKGLASKLRGHLQREYDSLITGIGENSNRPAMERLNKRTGFKEFWSRGPNSQYHWKKESQFGGDIDDLESAPGTALMPTLKRVHNIGKMKGSSWTDIGPVGQQEGRPAQYPRLPWARDKTAEIRALIGDMAVGKTTLSKKLEPRFDLVVHSDTGHPKPGGGYHSPSSAVKKKIRADRMNKIMAAHRAGGRVLIEGGGIPKYPGILPEISQVVRLRLPHKERVERLRKRSHGRGTDFQKDIEVSKQYRRSGRELRRIFKQPVITAWSPEEAAKILEKQARLFGLLPDRTPEYYEEARRRRHLRKMYTKPHSAAAIMLARKARGQDVMSGRRVGTTQQIPTLPANR